MTPAADFDAYVVAASAALGLDLDEAALKGVAVSLAGLFRMAEPLAAFELDDALDPAPVYRP